MNDLTAEHVEVLGGLVLFCLILYGMLQEAKQNEKLTRVSQTMDSLYLESEGDRGNVMYSVMGP